MKLDKKKLISCLLIFYIVITGLLNLYGYFNLPDKISTHFSFSGKATGAETSTPIYLVISFALVAVLSYAGMKKEGQQKLKYILADTLIVICNFVMILIQL